RGGLRQPDGTPGVRPGQCPFGPRRGVHDAAQRGGFAGAALGGQRGAAAGRKWRGELPGAGALATCFSPGGAVVVSQGCQPLGPAPQRNNKPRRGGSAKQVPDTAAPPGLKTEWLGPVIQGLTPLAN